MFRLLDRTWILPRPLHGRSNFIFFRVNIQDINKDIYLHLMGFQRNTINEQEHKDRFLKLVDKGVHNKEDLTELFFLYNDILTPRKEDMWCGRCQSEVWQALKRHYGK